MNKGLRDTPQTRTSTKEYDDGYERIFGKKKTATRKKKYIQVDGKLVDADLFERPQSSTPYVMEDMKPYRSPLDGSYVGSRSTHKAHMRQHGVIEVGNEKLTRPARKDYNPQGVRDDLMRTLHEKGIRKN